MAGKHIILDLYDVDPNIMININNDSISIKEWNMLLYNQFKQADVNCLNVSWHNFNNSGSFTALYLLSESHLSIHTWPEKKYIAIDIFTCGNSNIELLKDFIIKYFNPSKNEIKSFFRGNNIAKEEMITKNESNNTNMNNTNTNNYVLSTKTKSSFNLNEMDSFIYY